MTMNEWRIIIDREAEKKLRYLDKPTRQRIIQAIQALAQNPHPPNSRQMVGYEHYYRLRLGDWRVVYRLEADRLFIFIIKVGARGDVYKNL